jgi:hypothetical protein
MSLERENLDGLLKKAKWPQVSAESKQRLEEFWRETWQPRLRLRWLPFAAAATIAIGIGAGILLMLKPPRIMPGSVVIEVKPVQPAAIPRTVALMEGRPMTLRERMMVGDMRPKKTIPTTQKLRVEQSPAQPLRDPRELANLAVKEKDPRKQRELIAEMLRGQGDLAVALYLEMVVDAKWRAVALSALDDVKDPPVQAFIDELGNSRVAVRFAAARVLGRIDGPETTLALVRMVERNTKRREALAALMYSGGTDAAEFMDEARHVPGLAITVRAVEMQMKNTQ